MSENKRKVGRPKRIEDTDPPKYYPYKKVDSDNIQNLIDKFIESPHINKNAWTIYEQNNQFYLLSYFTPFFKDLMQGNDVKFAMKIPKTFTGSFTIEVFKSSQMTESQLQQIDTWLIDHFTPSFLAYYELWPKVPRYEKTRYKCTCCGKTEDFVGHYLRTYCENCNSLKENIRGKKQAMIRDKIPKRNIKYMIKHLQQEIKIFETIMIDRKNNIPALTKEFLKNETYTTLTWRKYEAKHEKELEIILTN